MARNGMPLDVLIVDDSSAIRKVLRQMLQGAELGLGHVYEARDGREALEILKVDKVDVILSDINMPNMDGIELLSALQSDRMLKSIPMIMITTEGSQDRVLRALDLGASGYIRKPFNIKQIKDKLTAIVEPAPSPE